MDEISVIDIPNSNSPEKYRLNILGNLVQDIAKQRGQLEESDTKGTHSCVLQYSWSQFILRFWLTYKSITIQKVKCYRSEENN